MISSYGNEYSLYVSRYITPFILIFPLRGDNISIRQVTLQQVTFMTLQVISHIYIPRCTTPRQS